MTLDISSPTFDWNFQRLQDDLEAALDEEYPMTDDLVRVDFDVDKARGVITFEVLDFKAPGNVPSPEQVGFVKGYLEGRCPFPFVDVSKTSGRSPVVLAAVLTPAMRE